MHLASKTCELCLHGNLDTKMLYLRTRMPSRMAAAARISICSFLSLRVSEQRVFFLMEQQRVKNKLLSCLPTRSDCVGRSMTEKFSQKLFDRPDACNTDSDSAPHCPKTRAQLNPIRRTIFGWLQELTADRAACTTPSTVHRFRLTIIHITHSDF